MTETSPTGRPATAPGGSGTDGWITACESAHCVKVKFLADGNVLVGSTQDPQVLNFTRAEWDAFASGVVAGEFDLT